MCERCGQPQATCECPDDDKETTHAVADAPPSMQTVAVRLEKRKRGKVVTCISGLSGSRRQSQQLLTELKNQCGAGGTCSDTTVEIQGDHQQRIQRLLQERGYRVSRGG